MFNDTFLRVYKIVLDYLGVSYRNENNILQQFLNSKKKQEIIFYLVKVKNKKLR